MYNVIFNAIQKLVDKGSITIIFESNNHENIIKIQDSGEAIPKNIIEKIFEPLFTTKHQGTGLGLASCKQIIEEHNGTIHAENNPTSFIIKIPKEVN
jgi:two-component system sensor histidine kinase HydH